MTLSIVATIGVVVAALIVLNVIVLCWPRRVPACSSPRVRGTAIGGGNDLSPRANGALPGVRWVGVPLVARHEHA